MPHRGGAWNSSPPLLSPPLLIILLPILTFTLLFLTVPPLLSATTNLLQHTSSVKTSWNSLNILLVVLAILFGVFARRNDDEEPLTPQQTTTNNVIPDQNDTFRRVSVSSERTETCGYESQQWYGFSSAEINRLQSPVVTGVTRMRRSSSSYPDLRQMETGDNGYKFRFFDDYEIEKQFRSPARGTFSVSDHRKRLPEDRSLEEKEEQVHVKEIPVDTFEVRSSSPVKSTIPPPPAPAPPPPLSARRHSNQIHRRVKSSNEITEIEDPEFTTINTPSAETADTPPPSPPRVSVKTRSERKKSNVKREIAMVWASVLSNQRKRKKKQKPKNDHNHHYDNVEELTDNATAPQVSMMPPPPPPPPPSVFHSIFRKSHGKNKKIHSVPAPPPPPPSRRSSKPNKHIPPPPATPPPAPSHRRSHTKPPLPNKTSNFINETVETFNAGNQSPLIPIPPPLPPFKMPAMKFAVRGDFVKIRSNQSSRSTSPEREHIDVEVTETIAVVNHNGDVTGPVFCPSPDVNEKAATFIARLRGEWRLQKLNSIKEKGNGSLPRARD